MSKYFWKILEESQACLMSQIKIYVYIQNIIINIRIDLLKLKRKISVQKY